MFRKILVYVDRDSDDQPEVIVMGSLAKAGIAGFLIGDTTERVLDRVPCSYVALRPEEFVSARYYLMATVCDTGGAAEGIGQQVAA